MDIDPRLNEIRDCLYRVVVKAIIFKDGKVLFVKDHDDIGWSLPGGGIDYGEDVQTALVRELSEEIDVPAENIKSDFKVIDITIGQVSEGIPRCNLHFLVTLTTNEVHKTDEVNTLQWISIDDLKDLYYEPSAGDTYAVLSKILKSVA